MLLVAACKAPKLRSIQILPVEGLVTSTTVVAPAQKREPAAYCPWAGGTLTANEHVCPPMVKAKLAVPLVAGVPEIANESEAEPLAKVPEDNVAVKPVTPVDEIV